MESQVDSFEIGISKGVLCSWSSIEMSKKLDIWGTNLDHKEWS